jgi:UDP-GlcNAc:undecaprenyl-phosphate/decaprenyl-phosphate GlcNAc-1-phosphate transferase
VPALLNYAKAAGVAFAASLVLTFVVRTAARRLKLVAQPRADRWHKKPTALYGGIGIFLAFVATALLRPGTHVAGGNLLVGCAGGMFLVGLVDDIVHLKPYAKLVGQILFCTAVTVYGLRLHWLPSQVLDQALTIFWLVGITNAINLLDNLDGLAGGIAAIAALYLVYFCHVAGVADAAMLAAIFAGAVAGFLVFNLNPASIFMGDCGSLFLGFFLGALTLVSSNSGGIRRNVVAVLSVPVLLLLIPIIDTTLVTVTRRMAGRPASQGGRDHTSHRLVALGLSERNAALTLWTVAALSGAVAVLVRNESWMVGAFLVPAFFMASLFFAVFVGGVRVYQPVADDREITGRALLPTLADFTYKRRVFEVLCDVAIIVLAYYAAFLLRFDGELLSPFYDLFVQSLPLVIVIQLGVFLALGLYDGLWRYTSMNDLSRQLRAIAGAWISSTLAIVFVFGLQNISRSVLIIDGLILTAAVTGTRISFRLLRTWAGRFKSTAEGKRVLIYGAGDGGELLLRELIQNRELGLQAVGFVDDDPQKQGRMIHGVRVLGSLDRLGELAHAERVDEIVVSTTKLGADRNEMLALVCRNAGLRYRRMRIALE